MIGLPSRTRWRGVSRFEPNQLTRRARRRQSEIRSSPVYAGHKIKPLKKLGFEHKISRRAPAVLDRIEAIRQAGQPLPHSIPTISFPSSRAIHADVLKGMISYRIGFSECEHRRASNGQHARKPLFTESCPACQGQNSDQIAGRFDREFGPEMARKFSCPFRHTRAASLVLGAGGSHASSDSSNSRDTHPL